MSSSSGKAFGTILRGWQVTGLWPLNVAVALDREGSSATGMYMNAHPDDNVNEVLGRILPGAALLPHVGPGGRVMQPCVELGISGTDITVDRTSRTEAQLQAVGNAPTITLAVMKAVHQKCLASSMVVEQVKAHKKMKAVRSLNGLRVSRNGNLDTTAGLVCDDLQMRTNEEQWHRSFKAPDVIAAAQIILAPSKFSGKAAAVSALNQLACTATTGTSSLQGALPSSSP